MHIQHSKGANYLVCPPEQYLLYKEVLYFGDTKITPGTRIAKIGEKKRTSFVMQDDSYLQYEGTLKLHGVKYCIFSSTWKDEPNEPIYRFAFAMPETSKPEFLFLSNKTGQSGCDIDCKKVTLLN